MWRHKPSIYVHTLEQLVSREGSREGGSISLQMSIKCSTPGGQMCNQEAAVHWAFHFKRSSFFGKDSM